MSADIVKKRDGEQLELIDGNNDWMFVGEKSTSNSPFLQVQVRQERSDGSHWAAMYLDREEAVALVKFVVDKLVSS